MRGVRPTAAATPLAMVHEPDLLGLPVSDGRHPNDGGASRKPMAQGIIAAAADGRADAITVTWLPNSRIDFEGPGPIYVPPTLRAGALRATWPSDRVRVAPAMA